MQSTGSILIATAITSSTVTTYVQVAYIDLVTFIDSGQSTTFQVRANDQAPSVIITKERSNITKVGLLARYAMNDNLMRMGSNLFNDDAKEVQGYAAH